MDPEIAPPMVYYAVAPGELPSLSMPVHVRGHDAGAFATRLRRLTAALDPNLRLGSLEAVANGRSARFLALAVSTLVLVLGTVLVLSAAGIHALLSITVTRRRKEVGIRTALGASPVRLLASIFSGLAWQLGLAESSAQR